MKIAIEYNKNEIKDLINEDLNKLGYNVPENDSLKIEITENKIIAKYEYRMIL